MNDNAVRLLSLQPPPDLLGCLLYATAGEVKPVPPDPTFPLNLNSFEPKRFHRSNKRCRYGLAQ